MSDLSTTINDLWDRRGELSPDDAEANRAILEAVFAELERTGVDLGGIVLKPNFVTPGLDSRQVSARTVATVTYDVLRATVPAEVPGMPKLPGDPISRMIFAFTAFPEASCSTTG